MSDEKSVYAGDAARYEALIAREDHLHNIEPALESIVAVDGLDVIDLGAGTGRLAAMLAPRAGSLRAFDLSQHMLTVTRDKLARLGRPRTLAAAADHRRLPAAAASADLLVSGWSVSYLAVWNPARWRAELDAWLAEARRVLRPGGSIVLFESLGTGNADPVQLEHLKIFYPWLDGAGFKSKWIRTDYRFESLDEAAELSGFFFGEALARRVRDERLVILPECTGVYWLKTG
jgi:ubiquinone/menaquinone biosynthesis C-methylase UbiE